MAEYFMSDYQVLRDGSVTLGAGNEASEQYTFVVPDNFAFIGGRRNRAVLTFKLRPQEDARLTVEAIATGPATIVNNAFFSQSHTRTYQEAFGLAEMISATNQSIGTPIGSLLIEFKVRDGPITISDVVLHHKVVVFT